MYSDKMNIKPDPPQQDNFDFEVFFIGWTAVAIYMLIIFVVFFWAITGICNAAPPDEVAVDFTVATMVEGVAPKPIPSLFDCPTCKDTGWIMHGDGHQTKCPNCDLAKLPGNPFDIIQQAKELIRKGNELAKRGKDLLDAFEQDGKVTIDIKLPTKPTVVPKVSVPANSGCSGGSCKSNFRSPVKPKTRWRWKR